MEGARLREREKEFFNTRALISTVPLLEIAGEWNRCGPARVFACMTSLKVYTSHLLVALLGLSILLGKTLGETSGEERPAGAGAEAVQTIEARYKAETDRYDKAFDDFQKTVAVDQPFHYDLSNLRDFLGSQMRTASDADARQTAAVFLVSLAGYEVAIPASTFEQVWQLVPPNAASWAKEDNAIEYEAEGLDPTEAKTFLQNIADDNSNRHVQTRALIALVKLASRQHDPKAYQLAYSKLEQFKDLKDTKLEISLLDPRNKIVPGKAAPLFRLPAIDGRGQVGNGDLSGKWYLVDFWATWCGPCLGERAALQEAYIRFKSKGFTIVSISLDETPAKVVTYRKNRWSMPWRHAFLPGGVRSQTAKDFEVDWIGLPRLVLVAPDGKVAAIQHDLSREMINHTLGYYLETPSTR